MYVLIVHKYITNIVIVLYEYMYILRRTIYYNHVYEYTLQLEEL